jgi:hypothetical protein
MGAARWAMVSPPPKRQSLKAYPTGMTRLWLFRDDAMTVTPGEPLTRPRCLIRLTYTALVLSAARGQRMRPQTDTTLKPRRLALRSGLAHQRAFAKQRLD